MGWSVTIHISSVAARFRIFWPGVFFHTYKSGEFINRHRLDSHRYVIAVTDRDYGWTLTILREEIANEEADEVEAGDVAYISDTDQCVRAVVWSTRNYASVGRTVRFLDASIPRTRYAEPATIRKNQSEDGASCSDVMHGPL